MIVTISSSVIQLRNRANMRAQCRACGFPGPPALPAAKRPSGARFADGVTLDASCVDSCCGSVSVRCGWLRHDLVRAAVRGMANSHGGMDAPGTQLHVDKSMWLLGRLAGKIF